MIPRAWEVYPEDVFFMIIKLKEHCPTLFFFKNVYNQV